MASDDVDEVKKYASDPGHEKKTNFCYSQTFIVSQTHDMYAFKFLFLLHKLTPH